MQLDVTVPCVFICYTSKSLEILVQKVPKTKHVIIKPFGKMHVRYYCYYSQFC